jgi:DNA-binding Lrp family transcriptional regulator
MDRFQPLDQLRKEWIDQYVTVTSARAELQRFAGIVGRVVTVNYNGKALIDFQDGGWYDITASSDYLTKVDPAEGQAKYKNVNSAQVIPEKQS